MFIDTPDPLFFLIALFSAIGLLSIIYRKLLQSKNFTGLNNFSVCVIRNENECREAVIRLWEDIESGTHALGFDCEWISQPRWHGVPQPISLLQLASCRGLCCLFRLNELRHIPESLKVLLESSVVKLGVNCDKDAKLIQQNYGVKVNNFLDLRHLFSIEASLAKLSEAVIGVTLSKEKSIVCSDWNQKALSSEQIEYAAKDVWVAIEIFKAWSVGKTKELIQLEIKQYQNISFTAKKIVKKESQSEHRENFSPPQLQSKFARKTPLYDNCWMEAPDGEILCSCDKRKANWYIKKGLAEVICTNPFTIRLFFEPNSRPGIDADGDFYRQFKRNCCVVCGTEEPCMKHYVLPREYRKHFPKDMKSHQSHDIVLTCLQCHIKAKLYMQELKEELVRLCDAPRHVADSSHYKQHKKLKSVCMTLLKSGESIPEERKQSLEESVKKFFGLRHVNSDILQEISSRKIYDDKKCISHGEKVVEHFKKRKNGLMELETFWRKKFIQNLKPRFLPSAWSVNHNHKKMNVSET